MVSRIEVVREYIDVLSCPNEENITYLARQLTRLNPFPVVTSTVPRTSQYTTQPESTVPSVDETIMLLGTLVT